MKKILSLILMVLLLTSCGKNSARMAVDNYLKKYRSLDSEVLVDIEKIVEKENLTDEQRDKYRDILKKQYKDLSYEIVEEEYDEEVSYITVKISVYDFYKAMSDSAIYLENNREEFLNSDGEYLINKYIDFKLDNMKNTTNKVEYRLVFTVTKDDNNKYDVMQPTENDLKKIHGIYNYEVN